MTLSVSSVMVGNKSNRRKGLSHSEDYPRDVNRHFLTVKMFKTVSSPVLYILVFPTDIV